VGKITMDLPLHEPFFWIGLLVAIEINRAVYKFAKWLDKRQKKEGE
jgi:hypothetical protein